MQRTMVNVPSEEVRQREPSGVSRRVRPMGHANVAHSLRMV